MMRNIVGPRVRQARKAHRLRLTQDALAAALQLRGVQLDRSAISKIEQQRRTVTDIELAALAAVLEVSSSWLLGESSDPRRPK
jgi:transcriptional regulator with XRE-family HTH domain